MSVVRVKLEGLTWTSSTMESVEEVILTEIRDNYPFLYNNRERKYRSREERDRAWEEIASIVDLDIKSCKTRWRSIRDRYLKERRRHPGSPERKKWRLMPKLTFLDKTIEAKRGPLVLKRKVEASPTEQHAVAPRRILLPASPRPPSSGIFPVSILKAASADEGRGSVRVQPPLLQPKPAPTTASLFLLPAAPPTVSTAAVSTTTSSSTNNAATTDTITVTSGADFQRKECDPLVSKASLPNAPLDEEDYYGLSVAGRLKKLSQRDRALVRIDIEKLFLKYET